MLPQSLRILNMKTNLLYDRAAEIITKTNNPSISLLRVKLNISLDEAEQIMDYFVSIGFISDYHNTRPVILKQYVSSFRQRNNNFSSPSKLFDFDKLDGHSFEYFCADILRYNGFTKVMVTSGSGDYGVDILCEYKSDSYAIQCKCYNHTVGNKAVQEVVSGKIYYKCTKAVVMTNNYFSKAAEETARMTDAYLWDRHRLSEMLLIAKRNGFDPSQYNMQF